MEITSCHFLITHNHSDHKNLIDTMMSIVKNKSPNVSFFCNDLLPITIANAANVAQFVTEVTGIFGNDVELIPIRPDIWTNNHAQNPEHDYNVMFKLKVSNRSVLFMGDVSPQLFTKMYGDARYKYELGDVDFLVASHHGSNRSGELNLIGSIRPEAILFCSNPDYNDNLPNDKIFSINFSEQNSTVSNHYVSSKTQKSHSTSLPIFTTCCASGFYSLFIDSKSLRLCDGIDIDNPLLTSNFLQDKLKKRIEQEMLQFEALINRCVQSDLVAYSLITPKRLSFCASFPEIDERLFSSLLYLKHLSLKQGKVDIYKDMLSKAIFVLSTRSHHLKTVKSFAVYANSLFELGDQDLVDLLSQNMLMNNILSFDVNPIEILHNTLANVTILQGFITKLIATTLDLNNSFLHAYARLLIKTLDWLGIFPNNYVNAVLDKINETLNRDDSKANPKILSMVIKEGIQIIRDENLVPHLFGIAEPLVNSFDLCIDMIKSLKERIESNPESTLNSTFSGLVLQQASVITNGGEANTIVAALKGNDTLIKNVTALFKGKFRK